MSVNGLGFRGIERVQNRHHANVIKWVRAVVEALPDTPNRSDIPESTEVDELETFLGKKYDD
jgi:insertion element IS1 protein InsB